MQQPEVQISLNIDIEDAARKLCASLEPRIQEMTERLFASFDQAVTAAMKDAKARR